MLSTESAAYGDSFKLGLPPSSDDTTMIFVPMAFLDSRSGPRRGSGNNVGRHEVLVT